jgi:hypothetical protein
LFSDTSTHECADSRAWRNGPAIATERSGKADSAEAHDIVHKARCDMNGLLTALCQAIGFGTGQTPFAQGRRVPWH